MEKSHYKPTKRSWIKLWVDEWLGGTTRFELTDIQRSIFIDLLALAGKSRFPGIIASGKYDDGYRGYPLTYLAGTLVYDEEEFTTALEMCKRYGKISVEQKSHDGVDNLVIHICNWEKYQSEYLRQRRYSAENSDNPDYDSYDYWYKQLNETDTGHIAILVNAYCKSHKQAEPASGSKIYGRMGSIVKSCQGDTIFILKNIWDSKDLELEGDRLSYLAAMVNKRLGK